MAIELNPTEYTGTVIGLGIVGFLTTGELFGGFVGAAIGIGIGLLDLATEKIK